MSREREPQRTESKQSHTAPELTYSKERMGYWCAYRAELMRAGLVTDTGHVCKNGTPVRLWMCTTVLRAAIVHGLRNLFVCMSQSIDQVWSLNDGYLWTVHVDDCSRSRLCA